MAGLPAEAGERLEKALRALGSRSETLAATRSRAERTRVLNEFCATSRFTRQPAGITASMRFIC